MFEELSMKTDNFELLNEPADTQKKATQLRSYEKDASCLRERNFRSLCDLAARRLKERNIPCDGEVQEHLYASLERGTAILKTEEQVDKYMQAFGRKHYVKFTTLFKSVPQKIFDGFFDVVDWGSGPGLGIIALDDFCRRTLNRTIESKVREITMIEPSEAALQRALIHAKLLFPESLIKPIPKRFRELEKSDFPQSALGVPRLHLFSNILDLNMFKEGQNTKQISDLIKNTFCRDEIFLCVSPTYNNVKQTFTAFIASLISKKGTQQEELLKPIEKVFTKERDGCDVKMTGYAIRIRDKDSQTELGRIKNKPLLSALNARRDSTRVQRKLVQSISTCCSKDEYDILYRPNLMGDSPDMLILRKGYKAKLIFVCDVRDAEPESLKKITEIGHVAESLKKRLYNLLSAELAKSSSRSNSAFGLVTCAIYLPNLVVKEADVKKQLSGYEGGKNEVKKNEVKWQYWDCHTKYSEWRWVRTRQLTDEIYDELKNLLVPRLTYQQKNRITFKAGSMQESLAVSVAGDKKKIFGVFGSGKTAVLVQRAISAYRRTHKMILILTYNITLRGYIEDMLRRQFEEPFDRNQFYVVNYHQFLEGECHAAGLLSRDVDFDDYEYFKKQQEKFRKYGVILIDEAQDYSHDWFKIIKEVFLEENGEYVLFGDEKQNIYGKPIENRKIKTNIAGKPTMLKVCHRANFEITRRVNLFQKEMFKKKYETNDIESDSNMVAKDWGKMAVFDIKYGNVEVLAETLHRIHEEYEIPHSDVAVLGSSSKLLRLCEKHYRHTCACETKCMFLQQEEYDELQKSGRNVSRTIDGRERLLKLHFHANKDAVTFSTIHSYKGFEADTIIAIIQSQVKEKEQSELELIYTGLTRARENLFLINYGPTRYGNDLKRLFESSKL